LSAALGGSCLTQKCEVIWRNFNIIRKGKGSTRTERMPEEEKGVI
jgi:hypothetical protein